MGDEEDVLHGGGSGVLEQVTHMSYGYHIFGVVQGQTGWGFEQPGFVGGNCAHGRELDLDGH